MSSHGTQLLGLLGIGVLAVAGIVQYINMRERKVLRAEIRKAAAREMLSAEAYLRSIFEDPVALKEFRRKVDLVRDSWTKLKPLKVETTAHSMYTYLKAWDRGAAEIFDDKLDWQSQERIFNVMLSTLLGHLDDDKWLMENLIRLGHKHHGLGVKPSHYLTMQEAILKSLEEQLGPEWNDTYYDAWTDVFSFISRMMIKAAYGCQDASGRPRQSSTSKQLYSKMRVNRLDEHSTATIMPRDGAISPRQMACPHLVGSGSPTGNSVPRRHSPLSNSADEEIMGAYATAGQSE